LKYTDLVDVQGLRKKLEDEGVKVPGENDFLGDLDEMIQIIALRYKRRRPVVKTYASYQEMSGLKRALMRSPFRLDPVEGEDSWLFSSDEDALRGWKKSVFNNTKVREASQEERVEVLSVMTSLELSDNGVPVGIEEIRKSFPKTLGRQRGLYKELAFRIYPDERAVEILPGRGQENSKYFASFVNTTALSRNLLMFDRPEVKVMLSGGQPLFYTEYMFLWMKKP